MSIEAHLTRLENAKATISSAVTRKGLEVPSGAKIDDLAQLVDQIPVIKKITITEVTEGE